MKGAKMDEDERIRRQNYVRHLKEREARKERFHMSEEEQRERRMANYDRQIVERQEQIDNEAWLTQQQCVADLKRAETAAAESGTDGGGWNAWFDARFDARFDACFMGKMAPVLEATAEHIAGLLDDERKQSRDELAREVDRLTREAQQLFAIISELQQTMRSLGRIDAAAKRGEDIALAPDAAHVSTTLSGGAL
jgi:hypothetical protein